MKHDKLQHTKDGIVKKSTQVVYVIFSLQTKSSPSGTFPGAFLIRVAGRSTWFKTAVDIIYTSPSVQENLKSVIALVFLVRGRRAYYVRKAV